MAFHQSHSINSSPEYDDEATPLLTKKVTDKSEIPPQCCSARCNLAVLMFFGFAVVYGLRVNLSVAMVAMVNNTSPQPSSNNSSLQECPVPAASLGNQSNGPEQPDGGFLLGAFFFGYLVTQIPGGYLSGRLGGRIFLGGGVVGTAALTLLTPLAADLGVTWLFALRALEGFGEGVTFPAMMAMWARWAPPLERSRLMTFSGAGANFGGAGCLWGLFWFILVSDEPSSHPRISVHERDYIINSIGSQGGAHGWSVPLIPIIFSVPLWAIILAQMCSNWAYYTLLTSLPTYMDTVLHFDLRQNGFLSALPYLGGWLFSVSSGVIADTLLERELLGVTAVRKIFTLTGKTQSPVPYIMYLSYGCDLKRCLLLPAAFLTAVGFVGCSGVLAVTFLTLSTSLGGTSAAGVFINQIDIAPRYAGVLLGITNTFGTIPGVLAPIVVGYLTKDVSTDHSPLAFSLWIKKIANHQHLPSLLALLCFSHTLPVWPNTQVGEAKW
ncbi:hypothetical protein JZ751_000437 [Albula glossodonta]|uniref:Major facilitator superfamily (MFS) profile domain-containing protein n=1 Tax=Albula glossodonta TaxID=121402 RepID=A0A8T2PW41_9TELE|nr:hypothetical protein JZ751_000437 [Albula glossodonta]